MLSTMSTISQRLKHARRSKPRRGSVLLLALGVLAVLSISAVAYVTIVRLDRAGAVSITRRTSYQQQIDKVVQELQGVLVADLFGNKVVTPSVPATAGSSGDRVWPTMFEDGETWDSPTLDTETFTASLNTELRNIPDNDRSKMRPGGIARPDDAWLASTEPEWDLADLSNTRRFRQITNLRSAYRWYDPEPGTVGEERWVRGDGRFVDLAQWFIQSVANYADPSINLVDWTTVSSTTDRIGPEQGNALTATPATHEVYNRQMNGLEVSVNTGTQGPIAASDERQWADTDGDLRPDARWQVLDSLGNVGGLNWVVATRIIDASAHININSAIQFGVYSNTDSLGDGRTPADVDLVRIIEQSASSNFFNPQPAIDKALFDPTNPSFRGHLTEGLGLRDVFEELVTNAETSNPYRNRTELNYITPWTQTTDPLSRLQRQAAWEYLGQSPLAPRARQARVYPTRDLSDLMAYWGTNNASIVSRIEQYLDGPEENGYLPRPTDNSPDTGPLRAKESATDSRRLVPVAGNINTARPTLGQLHDSTRRLLTTISGAGTFSPVPVLNPFGYDGLYAVERVRVDGPLSPAAVERAFASFAWALAPMATNMPLHWELTDPATRTMPNRSEVNPATGAITAGAPQAGFSFSGDSPDAHYGGGTDGPARRLYGDTSGATYALLTSAALAVNLADAIDADSRPTLRALIKDLTPRRFHDGTPGGKPDISMTMRFPQGDVQRDVLGTNFSDGGSSDPDKPILIVGTDRQPYLREVTASSFFREDGTGGTVVTPGLIGDDTSEWLGCFIAVEIVNPHNSPISLGGLSVVIPETPTLIDVDPLTPDSGPLRLLLPDDAPIPAGSSRVYAFVTPADGSSIDWDLIYEGFPGAVDSGLRSRLINAGATVIDIDISDATGTPAENRMWFHALTQNPAPRPVLLMSNNADGAPAYVIDRLNVPNPSSENFPPSMSRNAAAQGVVLYGPSGLGPADLIGNYNNSALDAGYFVGIGYEALDERIADQFFSGQVVVTGTLQRMSVRGGANATTSGQSGFTTAVMDFAPSLVVPGTADLSPTGTTIAATGRNLLTVRRDAQAWLRYDPLDIRSGDNAPNNSRLAPQHLADSSAYFPYDFPNDQSDLNQTVKAADDSTNPNLLAADDIASFQLLIPNGPLNDTSEILRILPYATLCIDCDPAEVTTDMNDLRRWITAGEQMAMLYRADPSTNVAPTVKAPNQYIASLDPTRYVIGQMLGGVPGNLNSVPASMKIPLALRAPDCFEAMPIVDPLVQGRVNINTAPHQVLHALPLMAPSQLISVGGGSLQGAPTTTTTTIAPRVDILTRYRDSNQSLTPVLSSDEPIPGLRDRALGFGTPAERAASPGFVTAAEAAVLGEWTVGAVPSLITPVPSQTGTFLELGSDASGADANPLQAAARTGAFFTSSLDNPIDDPEEKLALYRAVSNIVTARSDVYIAWVVLRGYDPETIERIRVGNAGSPTVNALNAMDAADNNFRPAYESRWLVVLDRSQTESGSPIRRATDRPRVLLRVELPSSGQ